MGSQMPARDQSTEVLFESIATAAGEFHGLGHRHTPMPTRKFDNLKGQLRKCCENKPFTLDLVVQSPDLLSQSPQKE